MFQTDFHFFSSSKIVRTNYDNSSQWQVSVSVKCSLDILTKTFKSTQKNEQSPLWTAWNFHVYMFYYYTYCRVLCIWANWMFLLALKVNKMCMVVTNRCVFICVTSQLTVRHHQYVCTAVCLCSTTGPQPWISLTACLSQCACEYLKHSSLHWLQWIPIRTY